MRRIVTCILTLILTTACEVQTEDLKTPTLPQTSELRTITASDHTKKISEVRTWNIAQFGTPEVDIYGTDETETIILRAKFKTLDDHSIFVESLYPGRVVVRLLKDGTFTVNGSEEMLEILDTMMLDVLGKEIHASRTWYKPWTWWNGCAFETTMTTLFCGPPIAACIAIFLATDGGGWAACGPLLGAAAPFCIPHLANAICACGGSSVSDSCPCSMPFWDNNEYYCEKFPECHYDANRDGDACYKPPVTDKVIVDPDRDRDGIPNKKDKCPDDAETKNGYEDDDGCPDYSSRAATTDCGDCLYNTNCCDSTDYYSSSYNMAHHINPAKCVMDASQGCVNPKTTTQVKPFPYPIK